MDDETDSDSDPGPRPPGLADDLFGPGLGLAVILILAALAAGVGWLIEH
jgi:hypothetical protein